MTCQVTTFSPFVAKSDLGIDLVPGEVYYASDQAVFNLAGDCKTMVAKPHRRTSDGRIELQACGGDSLNKIFLAQPSTKPGQWVAELPCGMPGYLDVTFTASAHCPVPDHLHGMSYECFAGTYRLFAKPLDGMLSGRCCFAGTADTPLPPGCMTYTGSAPPFQPVTDWDSPSLGSEAGYYHGYRRTFCVALYLLDSSWRVHGPAAVPNVYSVSQYYTRLATFWAYVNGPSVVPTVCGTPVRYSDFSWLQYPDDVARWRGFTIDFFLQQQSPQFELGHEYPVFTTILGSPHHQWTVRFSI